MGLYFWHWTATDMLLVLVAGIVAPIIADSLKWLFARRRMRTEYGKMEDDRLVWAMLDADARKSDEIPADRLQPTSPGRGLILDLVFGALALCLLASQRAEFVPSREAWSALSPSAQLAVLAVFAAPLLSMLAGAFAHSRDEGGYDELEFRAGGRGIGLLLVAVALTFSAEGELGARGVMVFVNWATVIAGVVSIAGVAIMVHERNRLRARLAESNADAAGPSGPSTRNRDTKRRKER